MKESNLKTRAVSSAIWKFMERIASQMVAFVVSIIIARILSPDDYSVVSLVTIFFTFANLFISGGFNTALIQKKRCDKEDFLSVLVISVGISILLYGVLFLAAPTIANAYEKPILIDIIRIMALILPIYAVKSVWSAYISIHLLFRNYFLATIIGTILSGGIGILMALSGFGAWALVAQQMSNIIIGTIVLIIQTRLPLGGMVSLARIKTLFSYGWKIFVSSLIGTVYAEVIPIFVGLKYSTEDLSYYTQGRQFPNLVVTTTTSTVSAVLFPILAKYQDDRAALLKYTRKFIHFASFVSFPLMLGLFAIADNFILVLLTDKWLPAVPYVRIFCISMMFDVVHIGNCETIKAMGRSDIYLIIEIIKKTLYFITIAIFLWLSKTPQFLTVAFIVCAAIALAVNSFPNRKLLGYSYRMQLKDLLPNLFSAVIMCVAVYFLGFIKINTIVLLVLQIAVGGLIYISIAFLTKNESLFFILSTAKDILFKKGNPQNDN